jgi:D-hydroxyproline dehydrogenase subunit alpha
MTDIAFTFDGRQVAARTGQSLAAALTDAGIRAFRDTVAGAERGIFCGMGVCQDCLVTVDGLPNRRACMTRAEPGMTVARQVALPDFGAARSPVDAGQARVIAPDVLVIGGGAGGLSAAIAARASGASVVVLDERKVGGGQYYKQSADASLLDTQQAEGAALLARARDSGAEIVGGAEIWGAFDGPMILADCGGAPLAAHPRTIVVATGAYERPVMIPGWTLPGVMTTGAAQTLWRSYRTLPGRRVAVCGSGPLNLQVALELAEGGAEIVFVAERAPSPLSRPLDALALALSGPGLTWNGIRMLRGLQARRVPVRNRTELVRIEADGDALAATFARSDGHETTVTADVLLMNAGFEPQNEILRLLGASMQYDCAVGHLRTVRSETLETSVPGLWAVGDCAGLGGAPAARVEGRIAGRAAAARAGHGDAYDLFADQRELRRHRRFQHKLWQLHDIAPRRMLDLPDETIVCRCEELTVARLKEGLAESPGHAGTLKRATRVGMGRCQGRYCGPVAARLVAEVTGRPIEDLSFFAPRVPIKPVAISAILAAQEALDAGP